MRKHVHLILLLLFPITAIAQQDTMSYKLDDTLYMKEVVIRSKTAISLHGDTTDYRVDSFITDPLANTQDILKRLPGVQVSNDGKITIQGKPLSKLFINGKEYFGDDLNSVIKNLPAEVLEKIQVADWHDRDQQFSGVKNNATEKAINLQFKEKYSGGVYGRGTAGYGTKKRYQGGAFANYMDGKAWQLTAFGGVNNTGQANTSSDDGGNAKSASYNSPGVRTQRDGNLSFSYDKSKKFRVNGNYRISKVDNYLNRSTFRTTYLPQDSLLLQQHGNVQNTSSLRHSAAVRSNLTLSKLASLRSSVRFTSNTQNSKQMGNDITYRDEQADVVNFERKSATDKKQQNSTLSLNNSYMQKFNKEGRRLLFSVALTYNNTSSDGTINNSNQYYFPASANNVDNITNSKNRTYTGTGNLYYTEPINDKNSLILHYTYKYEYSTSDNTVAVNNNNIYTVDSNQSRGYKNTNINNTIGLTYQYSNDRFTSGLGLDAEPYSRKSLQTSGTGKDIFQKGVNYFPKVYTRYKLTEQSDLNLSYNGSITPPSLSQLQPIPNYTDSLNIFIGSPNLRPELNNNLRLRLSNYNVKSGHNMWVYVGGGWINNKIINSVTVTNSNRTTTPINANGNYNLNSGMNLTESVIKKKLTASVYATGQLTNNVTVTNGTLQNRANYTINPGLRLNSYSGKWFEGSLQYSFRWNMVQSAAGQQQSSSNNIYRTHNLSHDGTFILPAGFRLSYYLNYVANIGLSQSLQKDFLLVNVMLKKTFNKPHGLSLQAYAFDLFNNYPTVQRTVSDNYYEDVSVNRIGNYFMFSVIYKFTSFPAKKELDKESEE